MEWNEPTRSKGGWRRLTGALLVGLTTSPALAQQVNRFEVQVGAGHAAGSALHAPTFDVGVVFWGERWGIAGRYGAQLGADEFDVPYYLGGDRAWIDRSAWYASATARRRWFGAGGIEYDAGIGLAYFAPTQTAFVLPTELLLGSDWRSDDVTPRPSGHILRYRDEWGGMFSAEFLVGRKLSRRLGVKGGVVHNFALEFSFTHLIGFATFGF